MNEWYSSNYEFSKVQVLNVSIVSYFGRTLVSYNFVWSDPPPYSLSLIFYRFLRFYYSFCKKQASGNFSLGVVTMSDILQIMVFLNVQFGMFLLFRILNTLGYSSGLLRFPKMLHKFGIDLLKIVIFISFWKNRKKEGLFWALLFVGVGSLQMCMFQHCVVLWFYVHNLWLPFFFSF